MSGVPTVLGFNRLSDSHRNTVNCIHPENPGRISRIREVLSETGLLSRCTVLEDFPSIDDGDLKESHSFEYISAVRKTEGLSQNEMNDFCSSFDSVFLSPGSVPAVLEAVQCCRHLSESIMEGKFSNGFALVRPPGHHADSSEASGFCLFNNASQAAEAAFNFGADRILIVDLDVHHGHGTQRIFYNDKRVLYFSAHRYEKGAFWPHLRESNYDHIGEGAGAGFNVNVPLNETGCGDADYMVIFWNVLWPLALEFDPQFVIVSAGFDSCAGDPLGGMQLSADCYSHIVYHLKALARGKLLVVLEGGYNHDVEAWAVQRCVRVLTGEAPVALTEIGAHKESTAEACLNVISALKDYWKCFSFYNLSVGIQTLSIKVESEAEFNPGEESSRTNTADISQESLPLSGCRHIPENGSKPVWLVYEDAVSTHFDPQNPKHPECPRRVSQIRDLLKEKGIEEKCHLLENSSPLPLETLKDTHERPYLELLKRTEQMNEDELARTVDGMSSVYLLPSSFEAARKAAAAVVSCVDKVLASPGQSKAFAAVRPPGHHAGIASGSGFCLLNNVAVGVNHARKAHGVRRVLVLDWDIHHGNGTQEIFEEDDEVLFISIHRHEEGLFFPMGEPKDFGDVGSGRGRGFTVNIPWSYGTMGDAEYASAFYKIVLPIAYQFNPEIVFVSAGFDAARGDPLGEFLVSPAGFSLMMYQLEALANGKTVVVLEGGYNMAAVANSAAAVVETLVRGSPALDMDFSQLCTVSENAVVTLRRVLSTQAEHWKSLKHFQVLGEHNFDGCGYRSSSDESEEEDGETGNMPDQIVQDTF